MPDQLEGLNAALADRYRLERELGSGGMATVYLARDLKHNRSVAIKVLRPEIAATLGPDRFLKEIEIAARLTHPNILPLLDSGSANAVLYYVMPYIEGESLRQRLDREVQLSVRDAVEVTREVADALSYAHAQDIVHRDIKPENILLVSGHAVVADFGVARAVNEAGEERLTETGIAVGTPQYMSPEQAGGERHLDGRSDQYSLGCVLFEMLAGQPPFVAPTAASLLRQHLATEAPPLSNFRAGVPRAVSTALSRALAKTPGDRYSSVEQLVATIDRGIGSEKTAVTRPASPAKVMALVALPVMVAVIGFAILPRAFRGSPSVERIAVLPLVNRSDDPAQDYFVDGMTEAVIIELGQLDALQVISMTSVMRYKGFSKSVSEIARELRVDAVVEGSVLPVGNRIRITAHLTDGDTEQQLWARGYERTIGDVLSLQRDVARDIAAEVRTQITPQEELRLAEQPVVRPEAYQAFLRARYNLTNRTGPASLERAIAQFERAIELDPSYAPAYAGLASSYALLGDWGARPPIEIIEPAKAWARRAIELDSALEEAHAGLAEALVLEWDWQGAERAFERAININANYSTGHQWYGWFLSKMGRHEEAIAELSMAIELDPVAPTAYLDRALVFFHAERFDEALQDCLRALELSPGNYGHAVTGMVYEGMGRYDDALRHFAQADEDYFPLSAYTYARIGRHGEARDLLAGVLAKRRAGSYVRPARIAEVYASLGERDSAFAWLERAVQVHDDVLTFLRVSPRFDPLRSDDRFAEILDRLNLSR